MKPLVLVYIDVPQHFRIISTLIDALGENCEVKLISTVPEPSGFGLSAGIIHLPALTTCPGVLRLLLRGLLVNVTLWRMLRKLVDIREQRIRLVVLNDTGIAQRYLIARGNRLGWKTVLVQDGLTETKHREDKFSFRFKRLITIGLLNKLRLGHLGTSRYGEAGACTVLVDGPASANFFHERSPRASVVEVGFLRPCPRIRSFAEQAHILFWAVDFLGGLHNSSLHNVQIQTIECIALALAALPTPVYLHVRLHPGDMLHFKQYRERFCEIENIEIIDPLTTGEPFAVDLPLMSLSLQSAGVFDAIAAKIPSYFVLCQGCHLAPSWVPPSLLLNGLEAVSDVVWDFFLHPETVDQAWKHQIETLQPQIQIPFNAVAVREVLL